jgi:hypothetical protein
VCKAIPFTVLSSEDDRAHPHQPSMPAWETSASTCALCNLILDSVRKFKKALSDEESGILGRGWRALSGPETLRRENSLPQCCRMRR